MDRSTEFVMSGKKFRLEYRICNLPSGHACYICEHNPDGDSIMYESLTELVQCKPRAR